MLLGFLAARGGANDIAKVMDYFRLLFGTGTPRQDHRALVPPKSRSSQEQAPLAGVSQEQTDWHHCRT